MSAKILSVLAAVATVVSAASTPLLAESRPVGATASAVAAPVTAQQAPPINIAPEAQEPVTVLNTYVAALANAQFDVARTYMAPNAVVLRNGAVLGNRDTYLASEARTDAALLHGAQRDLLRREAMAGDGLALVLSEKRLRTSTGGKPADQLVTETALLVKTLEGWKIAHLHSSSRPAPVATAAR